MRTRVYDDELTTKEFNKCIPVSDQVKGRREGRGLTKNARIRLWKHQKQREEFVREVHDHQSQRIMDRDKDEPVIQIVVQKSRRSKEGESIDVRGEETMREVVWLLGELEPDEVKLFLCKTCLKLLKLCDCGAWR